METTLPPLALPSGVAPFGGIAGPVPDELHACRILIIDDEEANVRLLERVLARAGFENFISTTDSREAAALFIDFQPDLVLTDWLMPEVDGCAVIQQLRALIGTDDYLPIVVLTADITSHAKKRALAASATDFLTKPFDQSEVVLRIQNLLRARLSHLTIQKHNATLEESVRRRTIELERALTELRNSQDKVIQQERLAALGAMAGGIAHDFNNALSIIMGFGEILLRDLEHGLTKENGTESITTILTAAGDAARIVSRLSEFYRPEEPAERRELVDLNVLIAQAVTFTQPRWQQATAEGRSIAVTTDPGDIPWINGDAAELREMLTNLIFNAVDAMPAGGSLQLGTRTERGAVVLRLTDTGTGMSEDVRQRCLEPFFTTKGDKGTGLGLSMVFGIVQRHAGGIEIESTPGRGTTFILRFPQADPECAMRRAMPQPNAPLRVLVVDDQPILCQLVCEHLQEDLHTVETAFSGSEALEKFRAAPFDLVITDQVMAEMTGEQLAGAIKELNPKTPVILLTGYGRESTDGTTYAGAVDLVVAKPMTRTALRHAFAAVLAVG
jgi:signal transduction histidine kinase